MEKYIRVSDIKKVCDPYRDWDVPQMTADEVAGIVRCKDCVYLYRTAAVDMVDAFADLVCTYWESDGLYLDDYCSQGKRRKP